MRYQSFHFLALIFDPSPGPKFTKRGDDLLATQLRHSAKFHDPMSTHARASLSHRANTVKRVIDFSIFDLEGLPLGQRSPKGEMTYYSPRSTILQNSAPSHKRCTRYALPTFFTFWRWFWPHKVIQGQSDGANGKPVGPTIKCSLGSNLVSVAVFGIFRVKILTVDLLNLVGLSPRPKVTKRGDDLLST